MQVIIYIIIGLVVGYLIGQMIKKKRSLVNQEQIGRKQENLQKILASLSSGDEISNDKVEDTLGVSNATAERYLDELEKSGKLVQVGKTGRNVVYRKK